MKSLRKTVQREALRQVFAEARRPLSPREAQRAAQELIPRLGLATVYRNIRLLVEEGWLTEVPLPAHTSRYERATNQHHHHFHCRGCDRVFDLHFCGLELDNAVPPGFAVESHEVTLEGRCPECR